jgi:hypothetical protein
MWEHCLDGLVAFGGELMIFFDEREAKRLEIQRQLDGRKSQAERNRSGQFATPAALATDIVHATKLLLDPAIGTGAFVSALYHLFPSARLYRPLGMKSTRCMPTLRPHSGKMFLCTYISPISRKWSRHPTLTRNSTS